MKKLLFIFMLSLSFFTILPETTTFTLPTWFKKHKINNNTDYPVMVRVSFVGYDSPSLSFKTISGANSVGLLIEPKSDSNDPKTKFVEVGNYGNDENNSFTAIGIFNANQPYIAFSNPIINPQEKDYNITTKPGIAQFILE